MEFEGSLPHLHVSILNQVNLVRGSTFHVLKTY
jgi:hypothetical protein